MPDPKGYIGRASSRTRLEESTRPYPLFLSSFIVGGTKKTVFSITPPQARGEAVGALTSALADVNSALSDLHLLEEQLAHLRTRLTLHKARISEALVPISSLPNELFIRIFELVSNSAESQTPVALSHVCQRWREIALNLSCLWSKLILNGPQDAKCLQLFAQRSCHRRLHLAFPRVASTNSVKDWPQDSVIVGIEEATQIKDIVFEAPGSHKALTFAPSVHERNALDLHTVHIKGIHLAAHSHPWLQSVQHLHLVSGIVFSSPVANDTPRLSLPRLQTLVLELLPNDEVSHVIDILDAPLLERVEFLSIRERPGRTLPRPLVMTGFPKLDTLVIRNCQSSFCCASLGNTTVNPLAHLTHIRNLELSVCDPWRRSASPTENASLCADLLARFSSVESMTVGIFPWEVMDVMSVLDRKVNNQALLPLLRSLQIKLLPIPSWMLNSNAPVPISRIAAATAALPSLLSSRARMRNEPWVKPSLLSGTSAAPALRPQALEHLVLPKELVGGNEAWYHERIDEFTIAT
ncbi:hypothetical protein DL93DRAFT_2076529 [Clavulina sp. PMI_390]|nr:hypothetical protein DL93DRAFT_2076529 [Clavulina sp. PMI_390]